MGDLTDAWDDLKDRLPDDDASAAGMLFDFCDKLADRITALEAQVAEADRLADEADAAAGTLDCLGMHRPILELKIAAFRAAKGE